MTDGATPSEHGPGLRILSLNIQCGLDSSRYRDYVTKAWRHVLPSRGTQANLARIAALASRYDIVALQEADAGSLRTGGVNQVEHIAELAGFRHWHAGVTRDLRPFARHSLGCLSRWPLDPVVMHALPGLLPGRGALAVEIRPSDHEHLRLVIAHLALGERVRRRQLAYLAGLVAGRADTIVLGDLNCERHEWEALDAMRASALRAVHDAPTWPSWRPARSLDHILVSPGIDVLCASVLEERLSDHLPVAVDVRLRVHAPA